MSETPQLVDLSVIFPTLDIDLKYATADNLTGAPIYRESRCLLHQDAVTALAKSISIAQLAGLSLVVYDAYRPQQAQSILWDACPDPQYVVDVAIGSNHSRGTAIDVTLKDANGKILDMGAGFDEMHDRSHAITLLFLPLHSVTGCYSTPLCLAVALSASAASGGILSYPPRVAIRCWKTVLPVFPLQPQQHTPLFDSGASS